MAHHDFLTPVAYDPKRKKAFHDVGFRRMRELAAALNLPAGTYDIRSNKGGNAVSGEITLHADRVYVQASQPAFGDMKTGILIRSCQNREDYTGEKNSFTDLDYLNNIPGLALIVKERVLGF